MSGTRKIRPPKGSDWDELFRLTDEGEWIVDDGQPGVAFFGRERGEYGWSRPPYAFSYGTTRTITRPPEQNIAMRACCDRYGCANGRRVNGNGQWA